jgi:hypothetical protein
MAISSGSEVKLSGWCGKRSGWMSEDDWRGIGINFWLFMALWLFMAFYCSFLALYGFHGSLWLFMALYGFFNLKKPKIKSRESLLALTLLPDARDALTTQAVGGGQRAIKIQNQNQWSSLVTTGVNVCSSVVPFGVISSIDGTSAVTAMKREDLRSVNLV